MGEVGESKMSLVFTFKNANHPTSNSATTAQRIAALLDGVSDVAVVGNGPISEVDRQNIAKSKFVIRFNDCNFLREGEKTSLRVMRHPSDPPKIHVNSPIWHVSPRASPMWADDGILTLEYEPQFGPRNDLKESHRIFPSCNCGPSCYARGATAGASTGAIALSVLEEMPEVKRINVFGMNWMGADYHIDFKNTSLVRGCCSKCHFHQTASNAYGSEQPLGVILLIIVGSVVGGFLLLYGLTELVWRGRASGAFDACGPVHFADDELMKGDATSEEDEESDDGGEVLAPPRAETGVAIAIRRMKRVAQE